MSNTAALLVSFLLLAVTHGALRSSGPGLMRFKDGKPMVLLPSPVNTQSLDVSNRERLAVQEQATRYIDELLTQEMKLQMDPTNLEKFVTDMLMWRKLAFPTPPVN